MAQHVPADGLSRRGFLSASVAGSVLLVAGCSFGNSGSASKKGVARLRYGALNPPSLDPQIISDGNGIPPQGLLEGLTVLDTASTGASPAVAESWDVSADGLTYTVRLRPDAKWSNGDALIASDFVWTYKRLLNPTGAGADSTNGGSTFQTSLGIKNAAEYFAGTVKDWGEVGIVAVDDHTLKFELVAPNADFPIGLAHVSMLPLNPKSVQAHPTGWSLPANWVGNGPFVLQQWTTNTSMTLVPNTHYWDRKNVHLDSVEILFIEANPVQAIQAYRNNEVDIISVDDPATFKTDATLVHQLQKVHHYLIYHLTVMWSQNTALRDIRVRKAMSMALDRNALAQTRPLNDAPGVSLVPDRVPGWTSSMAATYDLAGAKQLLAQAGFPGGKGLPKVILLSYASDPGIDAIAQMWEDLGLTVNENIVDDGVYSDTRWKVLGPDTVGFYNNSFAALFTQSNFLNVTWGPEFTQQFSLPPSVWTRYAGIQNSTKLSGTQISAQLDQILSTSASSETQQFSDLVTRFNSATDSATRTSLFQQAAAIRQNTYQFIPWRWGDLTYLVKENVKDTHLLPGSSAFYLKGIQVT